MFKILESTAKLTNLLTQVHQEATQLADFIRELNPPALIQEDPRFQEILGKLKEFQAGLGAKEAELGASLANRAVVKWGQPVDQITQNLGGMVQEMGAYLRAKRDEVESLKAEIISIINK